MAFCRSTNEVGGRIWQVIEAGQGQSSFDDIAEALSREFTGVAREQLMTNIENCLSDLESNALIKARGRTALAKPK
jgi:hypothetical protein